MLTVLSALQAAIATSAAMQPGTAPPAAPRDEIVILGRWDNPLGSARSAAQGIVGNVELEARPRLRAGEILEVVPGLIVTQHSGSGKSNQMFLRGFNLDHGTDFATYVDGMPVNLPTHGHGQGYTDLNFLIPEFVERLEYRKGAHYAEVADFSSAGAAYLSTYRRLAAGLVKVGLGEDGFATALAADTWSLGGGDLTYGLQANRYDGPWVDVEEDSERDHLLLRYGRESAAGEWNVALMGYDATWRSADQVPRRAVESGLISRFGSIDRGLGGETSRTSISGDWRAMLGPGTVRLNAYTIDYDLSLYSNFTYFLDDAVDGDQFEQLDERRVTGAELGYAWDALEATTLTVGASLRYDDIGDVGLFRTNELTRVATVRRDSVEELAAGVYFAAETRWSDRLRTVLGARVDHFDFDVASSIAENSGRADDSLLQPKLTLIYALNERSDLYLGAGKGFHSNDARGTTISIDPATGDPADPVDPLVGARSLEAGFRAFSEDRLSVSASLWRIELDSELLFIGDAGTTEASRPSTRYGLEVPFYYRPADGVTLDFEVAFTKARFTDGDPAGDEIPGAVDKVLAAGVTIDRPNGFYATARLRYFGPRPLAEDGSVSSDSSVIVNAGFGVRRGKLDVRVDLLNAFDADDDDITYYYASRLPGEPPDGVEDEHFHPVEPRAVRAYARWRF
jgi:hypothetical protein